MKYAVLIFLIVAAVLGCTYAARAIAQYDNRNRQRSAQDIQAARENDMGIEAAKSKDYTTARTHYERACTEGNAFGCYNAGVIYELGEGIPADFGMAAPFYRRACNGGFTDGCVNLGRSYLLNAGAEQNSEQAAALFQKACNDGASRGCFFLGKLYIRGYGITQSNEQGVHYYSLACDRGMVEACTELQKAQPDTTSPTQGAILQIQHAVPLWALSQGEHMTPGSLKLAGNGRPGQWEASYDYTSTNGQAVATHKFQARIINGAPCLINPATLMICGEIPANLADANHLYVLAAAKRAREQKQLADIETRAPGQTPGAQLSAADQVCMKTFSETYQEYADGSCTGGYYTELDNGSLGHTFALNMMAEW